MGHAEIKIWLKTRGKTYSWLASKIFVSPATVRGWLSSGKDIAPKRLKQIKQFMENYEHLEPTIPDTALVITLSQTQFDILNQAASNKNVLIRDWATTTLLREGKKEINML